jgi:hypothetical protein
VIFPRENMRTRRARHGTARRACGTHPVWDGARFTSSLFGGEKPLRRFVLLWWRRFESMGAWAGKKESAFVRKDFHVVGVAVPVMHVKGEEPLCSDLKGFESGTQETSLRRARGVCGYGLPSGASRGAVPSMPGGLSHRSGPGRPPGLV